MSRLDAHWNCQAGFTRFSGRGARSARKMQLYADIRRWNSDGEHSSHRRRRVRVCERCALAWARRLHVNPGSCAVLASEKYMQIYIYMCVFQVHRSSSHIRVRTQCKRTRIYIQSHICILNIQQTLQTHIYMRGIRDIVARARTLTTFPRAYMCTHDLLS